MSNILKIQIVDDDEEQKDSSYEKTNKGVEFLEELKDTLSELDMLPIDEVREIIQSDAFTEDRNRIETNFWKTFKSINKNDCSLDSAILLQYFGFTLNRKPYNEGITPIEELELEELQIL